MTAAQMHGEPPRRGRGRPPSPEITERRRRELIEAAYQVFSERGYIQAGVADITQALGVGHGTFYRYFESKREILDYVIDHGIEQVTEAVRGDAHPGTAQSLDELIDQLRQIATRLLALLDEQPGLPEMILLEATAIDEELNQRLLGLLESYGAITASYLEQGIADGFVRPDLNPVAVGHALNAVVLPVIIAHVRGGVSRARRKALIEGIIDFVRAGIEIR